MADIEKWITINGQHIPIMKGESRAKAVSNFIKGKRKERNKRATARIMGEHNKEQAKIDAKYGHNTPTSRRAKSGEYERESDKLARRTVDRLRKDSESQRITIKGRAKTKDAIDQARYVEYKKIENAKRKELENNVGKRPNNEYLAARYADNKMTEKYKDSKWGDTQNKAYKLKTDKTNNVTSQSGTRTIDNAKQRDALIKKMYKDTWNGKNSYKQLNDNLESMVKTGKVSRGELSSLQYQASREHDMTKAHNKQVSLKGTTKTKTMQKADKDYKKAMRAAKTQNKADIQVAKDYDATHSTYFTEYAKKSDALWNGAAENYRAREKAAIKNRKKAYTYTKKK